LTFPPWKRRTAFRRWTALRTRTIFLPGARRARGTARARPIALLIGPPKRRAIGTFGEFSGGAFLPGLRPRERRARIGARNRCVRRRRTIGSSKARGKFPLPRRTIFLLERRPWGERLAARSFSAGGSGAKIAAGRTCLPCKSRARTRAAFFLAWPLADGFSSGATLLRRRGRGCRSRLRSLLRRGCGFRQRALNKQQRMRTH
jgi:hypothetical protein